MKRNIVINVNLKGGLIGIFSSPKNVIKNILENYNNQGYSFVYSLPPNPNPLFFILQLLCLIVTFGIYCPLPSYMMILEKEENEEWKKAIIKQAEQTEYQLLKDNNSNAEEIRKYLNN